MYLAHLEKLIRTRLEDIVVEEGVADRPRVEEAQAEQEKTGRQLGDILIEREIVSDYDLAKLVATHYGLPYLDLANFSTRRDVVDLLPPDYCTRHAILPLDQFGSTLTLAITEMPGQDVIDHIVDRTKLTPFFFVAVRRILLEVLETEKKRGPSRAMKVKTAPGTSPPAAATSAVRPPAARTTIAPAVVVPAAPPASGTDLPLPDLDLPVVSMRMLGATSAGAAKAPPARPATQVAPRAASVVVPSGALNWMDAAVSRPASPPAAPARPKITKFPFITPPSPTKAGQRTTSSSGPPAPAPARKTPIPAARSTAVPRPQGGSGWQSIFDVGEEEVRKTK